MRLIPPRLRRSVRAPETVPPEWSRPGLLPCQEACCCPAHARYQVFLPATATGSRTHAVDLLLCAHHFALGRGALRAAGAVAYDLDGCPVDLTGRSVFAPLVAAAVPAPARDSRCPG